MKSTFETPNFFSSFTAYSIFFLLSPQMTTLTLFLVYCCYKTQLNGWRLFNVTSHCLASRLSRGATINTISSDFFDQSLLLPLTRAANTLNIHRFLNHTEVSVDQVRRTLFCRVINHFHEYTWTKNGCFRSYDTAIFVRTCARCNESIPR